MSGATRPTLSYSSAFQARVKNAFPASHRIHRLVKEHSYEVGHCLAEVIEDNWYCTLEEFWKAYKGNDNDRKALQRKAQRRAERYELLREWTGLAETVEFLRRLQAKAEQQNNDCSAPSRASDTRA